MKRVAYICEHNSCRSQIAEALSRHFAGSVFESYSAGTYIKTEINQDAVRLVKQLYGFDMSLIQRPKLVNVLPKIDIIVAMGCNVNCPQLSVAYRELWDIEDPSKKSDEEFIKIIKEIESKVIALRDKFKGNKQ
jgi:arsenate reductase